MIVYVIHHQLNNEDPIEVLGVTSSYKTAIEIIKQQIKNIALAFRYFHFYIEEWELNGKWISNHYFTGLELIDFAKEVGVYQ